MFRYSHPEMSIHILMRKSLLIEQKVKDGIHRCVNHKNFQNIHVGINCLQNAHI